MHGRIRQASATGSCGFHTPSLDDTTYYWRFELSSSLKASGKIILESLSDVYKPIIRDYALEVAVLVVGANSKVSGLREVCALAAVLLAMDFMLLCTFLASIFGVMGLWSIN